MNSNSAYDISDDMPSVDDLSNVQAKLAKRRKAKANRLQAAEQGENVGDTHKDSPLSSKVTSPPEQPAHKLPPTSNRESAARKPRKMLSHSKQHEVSAAHDRWVTPSFKVKESRIKALERIFFSMKASGSFLGKKQEFFDEALADMEKKYGKAIAK